MATRVTLRVIPGYPQIQILEQKADWDTTWDDFLRRFGIKLDPVYYVIYNKSRQVYAFMDEQVAQIMSKFVRKASITVTLVKLQKPNYGSGRKPVPTLTPTKREARSLTKKASKSKSTVGSSARQSVSNSGATRNTLQLGALLEPQLPPDTDRRQTNNQVDDDNEDAMSQLSSMDDDDGSGTLLKQQLLQSLNRLPAAHLVAMREELTQLKNSTTGRDYKWSHYAPRTSNWIFSTFKI